MSNLSKSAEKIAIVFDDWLKAEVITSGEGRNKYLDDFDQVRRRMILPYDDNDNWFAQKDKSHQQRWPMWLEAVEISKPTDSEYEFATARIIFAPLMSISGVYRAQSYLRAASPTEYLARRSFGTSVDLEKIASEQLQEYVPDGKFNSAILTMDGLRKNLDFAYSQGSLHIRGVSARAKHFNEMGQEGSLSVKGMQKAQESWAAVATDCVIMAAKLRRGELEAVPFLEPVSITDQSGDTHYPLRERVNWAEILAS